MTYNKCVYPNKRWDIYFHRICESVASKSPCLSRKIGAILVKDNIIVATGYNGPARGIPHCGHDRFMKDETLREALDKVILKTPLRDWRSSATALKMKDTCPRRVLGFSSGEGLEYCIAEHAERNCIASAARVGVSVKGAILYMNCCIPCKNCLNLLINAGVEEVVVDNKEPYDKFSSFILKHSKLKIREFEL